MDGVGANGKKRKSESHENRNKTGGGSKTVEDDFVSRNVSEFEQGKKNPQESTLDVLSSWYEDGESDGKPDCGETLEKSTVQPAKHVTDAEILTSRDSGDLYGKENSQENVYPETRKHNKRRWDEPDDASGRTGYRSKSDPRSSKTSDLNLESPSRSDILEDNLNDVRRRGSQLLNDRGMSGEKQLDVDEEQRQQGHANQDVHDTIGRSSNPDGDVGTWVRDKSRKDVDNLDVPRISEKLGRHPVDADNTEMESERGSDSRRRDVGKDSYWDDRLKNTDDGWSDKSRDREHTKDNSKRRQGFEPRDGETTYGNSRDWELPKRGRDRADGRPGGRKDGNRTEAVKTSSKYGISNENYDVIEIQTKPFDNGREETRPTSRRDGEFDGRQPPDSQELAYLKEHRNTQGSAQSGDDPKDSFVDDDLDPPDRSPWRDGSDWQSEKSRGNMASTGSSGRGSAGGSLPLHGNQESGTLSGATSQGNRGNRMGRVGRTRAMGRDNQQSGIPLPLAGSSYGALALPPSGPIQGLPPTMSPAPLPIPPGVFIPPFQAPMMWPGARGVEMNMLNVPPGMPPIPPGALPPGFSPGALAFNQSGPGRGMLPGIPGPNFNPMGPLIPGDSQEKPSGGWGPNRTNSILGKAPSRGEQNDYSQNFVDTGMRPQNFIRELELTSVVDDYPKLRELIQKKDEIVSKSASHPMYYKCDLREQVLSSEFFGTKFDVILVDPPWEEYVHRAPGVTDHMEYWTFEEIMNLKIEAITDTPSFIFLWVGDGVGLEQGRQCLKKWGFRRCEDICWVKTNKTNASPGLRHDSHTLFQRSKEHCLMGIKGTVRRSTDGHIIHANIDTDVIIAEEPPYGSTAKPEDMYRIIEHFALGRRRLELFGEDHNIRPGWLTVGKGLSSSNFNPEAYVKNFADKDGKVWMGGGGRNPPPEAPHLVLTTPEIESLRPKSPMKNQQQSASIGLTPSNPGSKWPAGNSPQTHVITLNPEAASSNIPSPAAATFRDRGDHMMIPPDDRSVVDRHNPRIVHPSGEFSEYDSASIL